MKKLYLITGASGHVGTVLVKKLIAQNEKVRVLLHSNRNISFPSDVETVCGDITDVNSLRSFFDYSGYDRISLIHCAALITIASKENPAVWKTNVTGTKNIMELSMASGVDRVVYVSSVHAIPERPKPETITEVDSFSPELVHGQYAKSKAVAAQVTLDYAQRGLNVSIVHPSGIIGPGDILCRNHMIRTLHAMEQGKIPVALEGGYDFVDSRDVAKGIVGCEKYGRTKECYILNGHYITVLDLLNMIRRMKGKKPAKIELPYAFARSIAPLAERAALLLKKEAPIFTPYSVNTLITNGIFSHEKASKEFGYCPRPLEESVRDSM